MSEFSLTLLKNFQRPITEIYGFPTLIDTGAVIPVFALPQYMLEKGFNAELKIADTHISGFGGKCDGNVYTLKNIEIGELKFPTMDVFAPKDIKPFLKNPIILSATLFHDTIYKIDTVSDKFTVNIPNDSLCIKDFRIEELKDKLYAQVDGVLFQDDDFENFRIDNYTQCDIEYIDDNDIENDDYDDFEIGF